MIANHPAGRSAVARPLAGGPGSIAAVSTLLVVALIYFPTHGLLFGPDGVIAAAATLLVLALSIAAPRYMRRWILGADPRNPILTLAHGSAALTDSTVSAWRRLAAITAGAMSSVAIAASAIAWSRGVSMVDYPHAIATLVVVVNAVLAVGVVVPIPGLGGWALLLALIDWRRPGDRRRIVTASRVAKVLSLPVMLLVTALGLGIGVPAVALAALPLGLVVWLQADRAAITDILDRFLAHHTAEDVARLLTSFLRGADPVQPPTPARPVVSMVFGPDAELLGFIGPRQVVRALSMIEQPVLCRDVVVPVEATPVLRADHPTALLRGPMARDGFALVQTSHGIGYVEASDLARQSLLWWSFGPGATDRRRAPSWPRRPR